MIPRSSRRDIKVPPTPGQVDFSTKLYYGFGAVANGATANGFNYLLLFYYSQVI